MSFWMAGGAIVGGVISGIGKGQEQKALAREADRKRDAEILGAQLQYSATESSVSLMKASSKEVTMNSVQEALRVGMGQDMDLNQEIDKAASSLMAQSEGLTSGKSRGRQMISLYMKGNKVLQQSKSQTTSVINQLVDKKDEYANQLNNKLLAAHQQMAAVLTTPGQIYNGSNLEVVSAAMSGAQSGASIGSSMGNAAPYMSKLFSKPKTFTPSSNPDDMQF